MSLITLGLARPEPSPGRRGLRVEHRQRGYEEGLLTAFVDSASGTGTDVSMAAALASVEIASGLWSRGLASARVSPTNSRTAAITAGVRARIGRELARRGEAVFTIDVDASGKVSLGVVGFWDIYSGGDFTEWQYRTSEYGPSSTRTRLLPAEGVIHPMYASSPARPWAGRSPLAFASLTAAFAAKLEVALRAEASFTVAQIVAAPENGPRGSDLDKLKDTIARLDGGLAMPQGSAGATAGIGTSMPPSDSWRQRRLGPDMPEGEVQVRADVEKSILACYGIPSGLTDPRAATGAKEAFRQFVHGTLRPVAVLAAEELGNKLGVDNLEFHFDDLAAADIVGRSKAFATLKEAGMDVSEAKRLAGLE